MNRYMSTDLRIEVCVGLDVDVGVVGGGVGVVGVLVEASVVAVGMTSAALPLGGSGGFTCLVSSRTRFLLKKQPTKH